MLSGARLALALLLLAPGPATTQQPTYDIVLRGGTVLDGTGANRFRADIAINGDRIARVGDLGGATGRTELDVGGLMVAPGFINVHSHASPEALPTAVNMLTQGVTTELLNADGAGPLDLTEQWSELTKGGLAVNVSSSIGFNSVWSSVVGLSDRRPNAVEIDSMKTLVRLNLERGAFGIAAGLDYKPAYYATKDEIAAVLEPARRWRTFFPNHDRSTPESGYSSRAGIEETIAIGSRTGLVPGITHMKIQGREGGTAATVTAMMSRASAQGQWVAADVYPYLAGQTSLRALIIPGWAQEGGLEPMRARFRDPAQRQRIIAEADEAMSARFSGPASIVLFPDRKLSDIIVETGSTSPGEAVVKVLETENPSAILGFGLEPDLIDILQYESAAVACDCGAALVSRGHPRYFGSFPRVLGRYVRELQALTWEDGVRKMSGLPAAMMGLVDRGLVAPGMAADIVVFDSATIIDHATYQDPIAPSEGIVHVIVNGEIALRNGAATGVQGGRVLRRSGHMPSRPMDLNGPRLFTASGTLRALEGPGSGATVTISLTQATGQRQASGSLSVSDPQSGTVIEAVALGTLQTTQRWASITGVARVGVAGEERAFTLIVEGADPFVDGAPATMRLTVAGLSVIEGRLPATGTSLRTGR